MEGAEAMTEDKLLQEFTSVLSLNLGVYMGKGLFENYPEQYNKLIPEFAKELLEGLERLRKL